MHIGIVGATGQVGGVVRTLLHDRDFPTDTLRLFASERSAGTRITFNREPLIVEDATSADYNGLDIVIFSAGAALSRELAPKVSAQGAVVIDDSSAWRMHP